MSRMPLGKGQIRVPCDPLNLDKCLPAHTSTAPRGLCESCDRPEIGCLLKNTVRWSLTTEALSHEVRSAAVPIHVQLS